MIKGSIQRGYNNCKLYGHNVGASKCIKQILIDMKGETENNTIIVGDVNISLSTMDCTERKIKKETLDLNYTLDQWT